MPEIEQGVFEIIDDRPYVMGKHIAWAHDVRCRDFDWPQGGNDWVWHERGFHCKTENGFILSTQWGSGNYCQNNHLRDKMPFYEQCPDAEIAVFSGSANIDDMCKFVDGDTVQGWVPAGAWFDILGVIASLGTTERIIPVAIIRDEREYHE